MIDSCDKFPHQGFPIRLEYQDGKERKTCWFQCQNHLDKHLTRYKLNQKDVTILYQDPRLNVPLSVVDKIEEDIPKKRGRKPKQQLFSSLEQFFEPNEETMASVGSSTGRESTQKRRRGRPSSNR